MMRGFVTAAEEAVVRIPVLGPTGEQTVVQAILDTGFTASLTLPPDLVKELNLPRLRTVDAMLADGSVVSLSVYEATVLWDGVPHVIDIQEAHGGVLLGMRMLRGCRVLLDVVDGGDVNIVPLGT